MIQAQVNQYRLKGGQRLPHKHLRKVLDACASVLGIRGEVVVSIAFVSSAQMRSLNRVWRGKDRKTDVLSFVLDQKDMKGEILLNYDQARIQAKRLRHSVRDELSFLIVHGLLHVWGHDHHKPEETKRMFGLQEKILQRLKIDSRI